MAFKFPFKFPQRARSPEYPEDIFDTTRMSFGDHIEELRRRLILALYGLAFFLTIGFVLDNIGEALDMPNLGIGRPMMKVITEPAESAARAFYERRNEKAVERVFSEKPTPEDVESVLARVSTDPKWRDLPAEEKRKLAQKLVRQRFIEKEYDMHAFGADEIRILRSTPESLPMRLPVKALEDNFDIKAKNPGQDYIEVEMQVYPQHLHYLNIKGEGLLQNRQYMKTQSPAEAFMVYFKVSLLCGAVLASPWIFYHLWAFVSAGLYPHEKKYIHLYLPVSVGLFIAGVLLCQFVVLPGAVKALIGFNDWIALDVDLRLNEWLGFALILPLVFGVSFQAPLVMFFLTRIGICTYKTYLDYWRAAVMILAVFSAIITPTPDVVTLLYLFVPMMGLYLVGILVCYWFPAKTWDEEQEAEAQVAV
jgi:sec-independent protein translocase protein TatC